MTVTDILDAIRRTNLVDSPGLLPQGHELLLLTLINGQVQTPDALGQIVVKTTPAGIPIRIGDIGTVAKVGQGLLHVGHRKRKARCSCSTSTVSPNSNIDPASPTKSHDEVEAYPADVASWALPVDPVLRSVGEIVSESIKSVRDAIILGLILASAIMVLFLRDWGTSIVAGLRNPGYGAE